ncbi:MAG TPA: enoyl-CoA hydratase-related protein, partial [Sphingomonas sp.]
MSEANDTVAPTYETAAPVRSDRAGAVAVITLDRPRYGNAQNAQMLYALDRALGVAAANDAVKAIVLRGEGSHFSSGH